MSDGRCPYCLGYMITSGGCDCKQWEQRYVNPPTTYKYTTIARPKHMPSEDDQHKIEQKIAKMISDGFDDFYRLSSEGYRLIQNNELLDND